MPLRSSSPDARNLRLGNVWLFGVYMERYSGSLPSRAKYMLSRHSAQHLYSGSYLSGKTVPTSLIATDTFVLIAYVIGISIAVHLLNLLCIPAIVLVFYYKKFKNPDGRGSIAALLVSFVIVALILYGLVPGFIEMAQYSELFCVNTLGMGYNSGALLYTIVTFAVMIWAVAELYRQKSPRVSARRFPYSILLRHTVYRRQLAGVSGNILRTALVSIHLYEEDSRKDIQCSGAQHTRYIHRL